MEDESMHIVMEYAEKGDLYKVSFSWEFILIASERSKSSSKVFFWKGSMGFFILDMHGSWVSSLEKHHSSRY